MVRLSHRRDRSVAVFVAKRGRDLFDVVAESNEADPAVGRADQDPADWRLERGVRNRDPLALAAILGRSHPETRPGLLVDAARRSVAGIVQGRVDRLLLAQGRFEVAHPCLRHVLLRCDPNDRLERPSEVKAAHGGAAGQVGEAERLVAVVLDISADRLDPLGHGVVHALTLGAARPAKPSESCGLGLPAMPQVWHQTQGGIRTLEETGVKVWEAPLAGAPGK